MFRLIVLALVYLGCTLGATVPLKTKLPPLDGRIVGGEATTIDKYPHQVSLQFFGRHRCGGAIISEDTVLTAAHCVYGVNHTNLVVLAGTTYKNGQDGQKFQVKEAIPHENYSSGYDFDIALLKLDLKVKLGVNIGKIGLPEVNAEPTTGTIAEVSGWGALFESAASASDLQVVSVPIVDRKKCTEAYQTIGAITDNMICAGYANGGKDACQGDSGGPMIVGDTIVGVVSWGFGCARPKYPGVYTNVAALRGWIDDKMSKF